MTAIRRKYPKGRILLVNPWVTDFAAFDFYQKPLGLLQIARVLHEAGYDCTLLDCMDRHHDLAPRMPSNAQGRGPFFKTIIPKPPALAHVPRHYHRYGLPVESVKQWLHRQPTPDLICLTSGMTYWYPGLLETSLLLRSVWPRVPQVLGGIYATLCPDHARRTISPDYLLTGPGESQILEIAAQRCGQEPEFTKIASADVMPLWSLYHNLPTATLATSRGCPLACPFCASGLLHPGFHQRPVEAVLCELSDLATMGVRHLAFADDALLINQPRHFRPIFETVAELNLNMAFHTPNGLSPRDIHEETALLMKKAGFRSIQLSYESRDVALQERMGKVADQDLEQAVHWLQKAGFEPGQLGVYLLMGLPGQSVREVAGSMAYVWSLGLKVSLAAYTPIPGTETYEQAIQAGLIMPDTDPLLLNNALYPMARHEFTYAQFRQLAHWARQINGRLAGLHWSDAVGLRTSLPAGLFTN